MAGLSILALTAAPGSFAAARATKPTHRHNARGRVTVKPSRGYPGTFLHLSFRAPDRTGVVGGEVRYYVVSASETSGSGGCTSQLGQDVYSSRAHARVRVTLKPGNDGWCLGTFKGTVTEQERPVCPFREVCPMYIVIVRTIGKFKFTIQAQPPGGDKTPPVFAGLRSAVYCTPGPERPGESVPYNLSWRAAHDNVSPSSQIVYDIFKSTTPGGENFSEPTWTSPPGATKFQTPDLPASGSTYFVVRARDQAGNEDSNDIERQGADPCL